jgi:hypothetical protein
MKLTKHGRILKRLTQFEKGGIRTHHWTHGEWHYISEDASWLLDVQAGPPLEVECIMAKARNQKPSMTTTSQVQPVARMAAALLDAYSHGDKCTLREPRRLNPLDRSGRHGRPRARHRPGWEGGRPI